MVSGRKASSREFDLCGISEKPVAGTHVQRSGLIFGVRIGNGEFFGLFVVSRQAEIVVSEVIVLARDSRLFLQLALLLLF